LSKLSILDWLAVSGGTVCAQFRGDIVVMQKQRMMAGREIIPNAPIEVQAPHFEVDRIHVVPVSRLRTAQEI
jgi:hypothetical protein